MSLYSPRTMDPPPPSFPLRLPSNVHKSDIVITPQIVFSNPEKAQDQHSCRPRQTSSNLLPSHCRINLKPTFYSLSNSLRYTFNTRRMANNNHYTEIQKFSLKQTRVQCVCRVCVQSAFNPCLFIVLFVSNVSVVNVCYALAFCPRSVLSEQGWRNYILCPLSIHATFAFIFQKKS